MDVVEAAYAPEPSDDAWGGALLEAAASAFPEHVSAGLLVLQHAPDCSSAEVRLALGPSAAELARDQAATFGALGPRALRALYYPPSLVATQLEIGQQLEPEPREYLAAFRARHGAHDGLGLVTHPEPGVVTVLYAGYPEEVTLSPHGRKLLAQVALHLEAGYRLRLRPDIVRAVITSDGKVVHHERGAPSIPAIRDHVARVEHARRARTRQTPEALELWAALVAGTSSLVERREGSRRIYLVVDNAPAAQPLRALTRGELDVVSHVTRGLSAKLVAYALGISAPTVSARLASAASKIGLATRIELVRLAAMLTRDPRARFADIRLTAAERDVLELLAQGLTNRDIAAMRNRSVRTIANQVATLLRKTQSPTRRALAARPSPAE